MWPMVLQTSPAQTPSAEVQIMILILHGSGRRACIDLNRWISSPSRKFFLATISVWMPSKLSNRSSLEPSTTSSALRSAILK